MDHRNANVNVFIKKKRETFFCHKYLQAQTHRHGFCPLTQFSASRHCTDRYPTCPSKDNRQREMESRMMKGFCPFFPASSEENLNDLSGPLYLLLCFCSPVLFPFWTRPKSDQSLCFVHCELPSNTMQPFQI